MSTFTEKEIEYLRGQRLGRLATVGSDGVPHVVPVGFRLGPADEAIEVGGHGLKGSKKWRDLGDNPRVAFVVDDLERVNPWTPRGLEIRGRAELHEEGGESFGSGWDPAWIRILPRRIVSWGIEGPAFSAAGRRRARLIGGGGDHPFQQPRH
jgi:pyridoxamine 5'-phosphate oxidase family protein